EYDTCGKPPEGRAASGRVPHTERTAVAKAFAVLNPGDAGDAALVQALQAPVKTGLAAHEYPRAIAFVDSLPMTATGKIVRRALREA
ncbi:AMP-binding enzyme, partial [Burkholderia thailandensis]|uniref:AMP-binding enzyme n=1 Tax=Burkholderia thailandensis TaxID=57975 RepID=UPI003F68B48B|nr:AMP-dependent synthetase [Burkholderia thailandensis]